MAQASSGRADVAVADHGNLHRIFYRGDPLPARVAAVAHFAGAGVQRNRRQAARFRHARQFHADDLFVIPSRAEFHGEGNLHGAAHRFENLADRRQIAQQAGASVALHDFFRRAAQIQIDQIEAQALDHARGLGHHLRIAAEKLRRNRVLVFIEVEIALGLLIFLAEHAVGRGELGHDQAASAQVADEAAEDGVGDAGHGREDGRGRDA